MIKTEIDDKKCKILLNGIEKQGENMTLAMRIIAKDLQSSSFPLVQKEPL